MRIPPQKLLHDLLLASGDKELEIYAVDKDLEAIMPGLRRALPAFWGRRACKALAIDRSRSVPLEALALCMASTGSWYKPPEGHRRAVLHRQQHQRKKQLLCTAAPAASAFGGSA